MKLHKEYKHPQFTATFATENGYYSLTGHIAGACGAVGHHIAEILPEFKLLDAVHLKNIDNIPVEVEQDLLDTLKALEIYETGNTGSTYAGIPSDGEELTGFPEDWSEEELDKISALAKHLNCPAEWITMTGYDTCIVMGSEYLVLTDSESDQAWEEELDRYIDELLDIPDNVRPYFDEELWKRDAKIDGRGHSLSGYDGCEYEETGDVTGETYFIYQQ